MKPNLDMDKIANALGAERRGQVKAGGGHFGAAQLAAEVAERFKAPPRGGRRTDPSWDSRRLLPLSEETLQQLAHLAQQIEEQTQTRIGPMQIAALLLERALTQANPSEISKSTHASG